MNDGDLVDNSQPPTLRSEVTMTMVTCDVENYPNYFLIYFRNIANGNVAYYSMYNNEYSTPAILTAVRSMLETCTSITFNGRSYDMPLIALFLQGANNHELYKAGQDIIANRLMPWDFERKYNVDIPGWDHIDLIDVAFGVASLKIYGARLGTRKLQELPIHHNNLIMPGECQTLTDYCGNDNEVTAELYFELKDAIDLRVEMSAEYGIDLRSKSDAQIAEHVIKSEYKKRTGQKLNRPKAKKSYRYHPPAFVKFKTEQFAGLLETCMSVDFNISDKGAVLMPKELNKQIPVAEKRYKMGIGGLHSVDKGGSYYACDDYELIDIDVTSYYPNIILNAGFEPVHIGSIFTDIYSDILKRRIKLKQQLKDMLKLDKNAKSTPEYRAIDNAQESLKIVVNGLFGKFGSRYSAVYSPDLMFHTTVTGQLCLFMLIEQFNLDDIQVVSANTDGITVLVHKDQKWMLDHTVKQWEAATAFNMEYVHYKSAHYRDVNNYFAVTLDDGAKGKGIFAPDGIRKNPAHAIVRDACMAKVVHNVEPTLTIYAATDITKFLEVRKVAGGAVKDGEPLGAAIRWYISNESDTSINYASNGNKVASSQGAMPMMDLPTDGVFPSDLDYQWYIDRAEDVLVAIGVNQRFHMKTADGALSIVDLDEERALIEMCGGKELTEKQYLKLQKAA